MSRNPYYVPGLSPWPFLCSLGVLSVVINTLCWFIGGGLEGLFLSVAGVLIVLCQWWRDVIRESDLGFHSSLINEAFSDGFILFILSEVMFFFSLFWAFLHSSLAPDISIGCLWPPNGIEPLSPFGVPLCGTVVLLSSGVSVSYAHAALKCGLREHSLGGLVLTVLLGLMFSSLQGYEYYWASFTIADSIYGCLFYLLTGFHGVHVVVGEVFLLVVLVRLSRGGFTPRKHLGFTLCCWYWHFVDLVWIVVYLLVYLWGSGLCSL